MEQQIIYLSVSDIKPYENNPRDNTFAVDAVALSIRKNGFRAPILLDKERVIIAGHTRWLAAQKLGMDKVPCIIEDDMSAEQVRAYRIADNKTAEASSWDDELLRAELEALQQQSYELTDMGFSSEEVSEILDQVSDADFEDFFTAAPTQPQAPAQEKQTEDKPADTKPEAETLEAPKQSRIQCPHCGEWIEL